MTTEDKPIKDCAEIANQWIANGYNIYQKFSCPKCGERLTMNEPNIFYELGVCDHCGHESKITHCGFLATTMLTGGRSG